MEPYGEEPQVAAWLARTRPSPDETFVEQTERRLLRPARRRRRPALAALGVTGALAATAIATMLVGTGPLDGDDAARAKPDCSLVQVTRMQREGQVVVDRRGDPRVVYRTRPVTRTVKRCR
jgi:hypothetical protein